MATFAAILQFLTAQLGKPYVFGAAGPDSYDCSGLVQAAYASIGVQVPRLTWDQVRDTISITGDQLVPGDLVFANFGEGPNSHVGIYVGGGDLIVAPQTGDVVKREPLSGWAGHITAYRRVVPAFDDQPAVPAWPGRFLRWWGGENYTIGNDVRTWQQRMADRGWHLGIDGAYGPVCDRVCRQFQTEKGLTVDGIVGPQTWAASWTAPIT